MPTTLLERDNALPPENAGLFSRFEPNEECGALRGDAEQQAQNLLAQASITLSAAMERMAESPEDVTEAQNAVMQAQQLVRDIQAAKQQRRSPGEIMGKLATLGTLVCAVSNHVAEHETEDSVHTTKKTIASVSSHSAKAAPPKPPSNGYRRPKPPSTHHRDDWDECVRRYHPAKPGHPNHDGYISIREEAMAAAGLGRAAMEPHKRGTAIHIAGEIAAASAKGDRRGVFDGALAMGRGVARDTGSEDVGHAVTVAVGTAVTKTHTAANLVGKGDGWGIIHAIGRNLDAVRSYATDAVGLNSLANEIRKHGQALLHDGKTDWKHLVNARGEHLFDIDGNGEIDAQELISVFRNNGITFADIDANHDNHIDFYELTVRMAQIARKNHGRTEH